MDKNGNKTGGRKAGTPNKTTKKTKEAIAELLTTYVNTTPEEAKAASEDAPVASMMADFCKVKPVERLMMAEKMMQYLMPKMQSASIDAEITEKQKKNAEKLVALSKIPSDTKPEDE